MRRALLLIAFVGCGDAFVAADPSTPDDAGGDNALTVQDTAPEASPRDDAAYHDAAAFDVTPPDARSGDATAADASPPDASPPPDASKCTPWGPFGGFPTGTPCNTDLVVPGYFEEVLNVACVGPAQPTPPECQCQETYTCVCLYLHNACGSGAWVRCSGDDGQHAITVTCQ